MQDEFAYILALPIALGKDQTFEVSAFRCRLKARAIQWRRFCGFQLYISKLKQLRKCEFARVSE